MIVHDLNILGSAIVPAETDPPLIIDPDAVLPRAIAREPFEAVTRRYTEIVERIRRMHHQQLSKRDTLNDAKPPGVAAQKQGFRMGTSKAPDHSCNNNAWRS